jgi:hypothetical protein
MVKSSIRIKAWVTWDQKEACRAQARVVVVVVVVAVVHIV